MSFDSTHTWETGMQTYIAGVQTLAVGVPPSTAPPPPARALYCDLAVRWACCVKPRCQVGLPCESS